MTKRSNLLLLELNEGELFCYDYNLLQAFVLVRFLEGEDNDCIVKQVASYWTHEQEWKEVDYQEGGSYSDVGVYRMVKEGSIYKVKESVS